MKKQVKPPIATGCLDYFPDALAEVALVSLAGQKPLSSSMPIAPYPTESNGIPISVSDQIIDTEVING